MKEPLVRKKADARKASCSKCGEEFPTREAAVKHARECQRNWNPTLEELCK